MTPATLASFDYFGPKCPGIRQVWSMNSSFESIPPADGTASVDARKTLEAATEEARGLVAEGRLVRRTGDRAASLQVCRH
jgi:hypothetical protein